MVLVAASALAATPLAEIRVSPIDVDAMQAHDAGAGTSGVPGIRTTVVMGDPTKSGPYTIRLTFPRTPASRRIHIETIAQRSSSRAPGTLAMAE